MFSAKWPCLQRGLCLSSRHQYLEEPALRVSIHREISSKRLQTANSVLTEGLLWLSCYKYFLRMNSDKFAAKRSYRPRGICLFNSSLHIHDSSNSSNIFWTPFLLQSGRVFQRGLCLFDR